MGDIISLFPISLNSTLGRNLVIDICRAAEGLIKDDEVRDKYGLSAEVWRNSIKDKALVQAVRAERERRILNGAAVREAACRHLVKGPGVLNEIMTNELSNPRAKIEAIKELRQTAIGESTDGIPDNEKFIITINLGDGVIEHYEKPLTTQGKAKDKPLTIEGHADGEE